MKTSFPKLLAGLAALLLPLAGHAQVNSGSNGSDGAFNPTANVVINMADHPDGIYQYTSVNIPAGVTVSFIPNAGNKPVVWLVQGDCVIAGTISVNGIQSTGTVGTAGGPGGYSGGNMALGPETPAGAGLGPGGGQPGINPSQGVSSFGGSASFGTMGQQGAGLSSVQAAPGDLYGSGYLIPLVGGSGGGGSSSTGAGAGGGGAILIASGGGIVINGNIYANGGDGSVSNGPYTVTGGGGGGSGGAIRLIATAVSGGGSLRASGGSSLIGWVQFGPYAFGYGFNQAGSGRIRIDSLTDSFSGATTGVVTRGYQPIIIPPANQSVALTIQSVAGVAVAANPVGQLTMPDVIVPANQQNPISIVVGCTNIPLNTEIIVDVKPANGATIRAVALNSAGTQAASTATVQVNMPRGGGTIQAKAVSGLALAAANGANDKLRSLAETGWTADGERFAKVEVTATLGGAAQIAYLTESGKRLALPAR